MYSFRKIRGGVIDDIIDYVKNYIINYPEINISIGCDSRKMKTDTIYVITLMLYCPHLKNGAHILYFKKSYPNIKSNSDRLNKEAELAYSVSEFFQNNLIGFYKRKDLNECENIKYLSHLKKCNDENEINTDFKLIDIHLDFNPNDGNSKNKSYLSYKIYVPWLRSIGWRVWAKPMAYNASGSADFILRN